MDLRPVGYSPRGLALVVGYIQAKVVAQNLQ
jgi:hypothetical protein